jgi:hypothetical protein
MKQKQNETEHLLSTEANRYRLLEEVAERLYSDKEYPMYGEIRRDGFINGAKWQQEQYTIEEQNIGHTIDELDKEYIKGFNEGSAWQQERSYSEEEVWNICNELASYFIGGDTFYLKEWFEQFKNK